MHSGLEYDARGAGVQGWEELINAIGGDYVALGNSAVEGIICPDFNIPRFYLAPGRVLRYLITGFIGTQAAAATLTFRVRWGGVAGTYLGGTSALSLAAVANLYGNFRWEGEITCRAAGPGTTGKLLHSGMAFLGNRLINASFTAADFAPAILTSNGTGGATTANPPVDVDTTIDKLLSFTGQFSVANASNTVTVNQALLEALN